MEIPRNITGLILAGGAGRRVGHRDKGLITWQGRPLIAHVCDRLRPQVGEIIISCNRNRSQYRKFSSNVVLDSRKQFQGPLAGIEAASTLLRTDYLAVVCCDMPTIPVDLVERLLAPLAEERTGNPPPDISYVFDGERSQYLCAVMKRTCLSTLDSFLRSDRRAVRDWYQANSTAVVDFSDCRTSFRNVNEVNW